MAWQTPKTDWDTDDGIQDSDFNRIEGDLEYLYSLANSFWMCGAYTGIDYVTVRLPKSEVQTITKTVPAGKILKVKKASYNLYSTAQLTNVVRLQISDGTTTWTSSAVKGDESPDFTLYDNSSGGSDVDIDIVISISNTISSYNHTYVDPYPGWSVRFEFE